jgi:hypothetical protein
VVRCSIAGISLRGPKRLQLRSGVSLTLSRETIASLTARAAADGCSEAQLASDLLETIARDSLYDAVLDSAPLAPILKFSGKDRFAAPPGRGSDEGRLTDFLVYNIMLAARDEGAACALGSPWPGQGSTGPKSKLAGLHPARRALNVLTDRY